MAVESCGCLARSGSRQGRKIVNSSEIADRRAGQLSIASWLVPPLFMFSKSLYTPGGPDFAFVNDGRLTVSLTNPERLPARRTVRQARHQRLAGNTLPRT